MDNNLKEKEVLIDIESGEASEGGNAKPKLGKISLKRLVSGVLSYNGSVDVEAMSKNLGGESSLELVPLVENEHDKRGVKVKKASKPPRPPKAPSLDVSDMRMLKEISKTTLKKRERKERLKALKKLKSTKLLSAPASSPPLMTSSSSSSSSSCSSSIVTISAMLVSVFFFLVLFFQGLSSSTTSTKLTIVEAPGPASETMGSTPIEFYKTVMSDDAAAPSFLPPKTTK